MTAASLHRNPRRVLAAALVAVIAVTSCGVVYDDARVYLVDPDTQLKCDEGRSLELAAQSVPSASYVPCVDAMPAGWRLQYTDFTSDGTIIAFDSSRPPVNDLTVTFSKSCDETDAEALLLQDDQGNEFTVPSDVTMGVDGEYEDVLLDVRFTAFIEDDFCAEFRIELAAEEDTLGFADFPQWNWIPRRDIEKQNE